MAVLPCGDRLAFCHIRAGHTPPAKSLAIILVAGKFILALRARSCVLNWLLALWVHDLLLLTKFIETISDLTTERLNRLHDSLVDVSVTSIAVVAEIHSEDCPATGRLSTHFALFVGHNFSNVFHVFKQQRMFIPRLPHQSFPQSPQTDSCRADRPLRALLA
jgi:hypothetical protein